MTDVARLAVRLRRVSNALTLTPTTTAVIRRVVIDPTVRDLTDLAVKVFGADRRPWPTADQANVTGRTEPAGSHGFAVVFLLTSRRVWVFGQRGARRHKIAARNPRGDLRIAGGHPLKGPVTHPGTSGKQAIDRARKTIADNHHQRLDRAVTEILTGAFHG